MKKILIVEDDLEQLSTLSHHIQQHYNWQILTSTNYDDAINLIDNSVKNDDTFSLFLFDVQLAPDSSDRGGFDLARHLRNYKEYYTTPLLFLTSISDKNYFAINNFHCYNYIPKPYTMEDISHLIEHMLITGIITKDKISITDTNNVIHRISPSDILYIKANHHSLTIYTTDLTIITREHSLSSLQPLLVPECIRCQKSYIINIEYAKNFDIVNKCINTDKGMVKISKDYIELMKQLLQKG